MYKIMQISHGFGDRSSVLYHGCSMYIHAWSTKNSKPASLSNYICANLHKKSFHPRSEIATCCRRYL